MSSNFFQHLFVLLLLLSSQSFLRPAIASAQELVPVQIDTSTQSVRPYEQGHTPLDVSGSLAGETPKTLAMQELFPGHHLIQPAIDFEDMTGWVVEFRNGTKGRFYQSRRQVIQGEWAAYLLYQAPSSGRGEIRLMPPEPITAPVESARVGFWVYATEWWAWEPQLAPPSSLALLFVDANNNEWKMDMDRLDWKDSWFWVEGQIPANWARPVRLKAICLTNVEGAGDARELFVDALNFYPEYEESIYFARDEGVPDWYPKRADATVPKTQANPVIEMDEDNAWIHTQSKEGISYRIVPENGGFAAIEVWVNGQKRFMPYAGGGVAGEIRSRVIDQSTSRVERSYRITEVSETAVTMEGTWEYRGDIWQYTMRIIPAGKSLVIEVEAPDGGRGFSFGRVQSASGDFGAQSQLVEVPMWSITMYPSIHGSPKVLVCDGLYLSSYVDWYASNASRLYCIPGTQIEANGAAVNGGLQYFALTDGTYNPLFERIVLSVSSHFTEVLPEIPNPPSPHREVLRQNVQATYFNQYQGLGAWDAVYNGLRNLRSLGVSHLFLRTHEWAWRDGGESYTMRVDAAPGKGGDEALARYVQRVQNELGWPLGLYTNYRDYAPVNANFTPLWVARSQTNELERAWARNYRINSTAGRVFESIVAPIIKERYGVQGSYTDVHTAFPPFESVDYNPYAPGAGMFKTVYQDYAALLLNDREVYGGPVFSEGHSHWIYSGLSDGNYGLVNTEESHTWRARYAEVPLLLDFQLLRIHPLNGDFGVDFWNASFGSDLYYLQLATTIAFGLRGHMQIGNNHADLAQTYHQIQPLQELYVMEPVASIQYASAEDGIWSKDELYTTDEAVLLRAYEAGRACIVYENGLRIWVNTGDKVWRIRDDLSGSKAGEDMVWELPKGGWLAIHDDLLATSVLHNGRRLDLVVGPDRFYVDPHGTPLTKEEWKQLNIPFSGLVATNVPVVCLPKEELLAADRPVADKGQTHVLILFSSDVREAVVEVQTDGEVQTVEASLRAKHALNW